MKAARRQEAQPDDPQLSALVPVAGSSSAAQLLAARDGTAQAAGVLQSHPVLLRQQRPDSLQLQLQLQLPLPSDRSDPSDRSESRPRTAAWWFSQMRRAVDSPAG